MKHTITAATLGIIMSVGISSNAVANTQENTNRDTNSQNVVDRDCSKFKPQFFHRAALGSMTKLQALFYLEKAEKCYAVKGDRAGIEKVKSLRENLDQIDFAKNRQRLIDAKRESIIEYRQQGKLQEVRLAEEEIRKLEQLQD